VESPESGIASSYARALDPWKCRSSPCEDNCVFVRFSVIAAPLALLGLVLGFYWRFLTTQYTWMDHPDMARQVLPWYQVQAASWQRGEFPLWDPHVWAGQPLAGQMQPGSVYPPNWLLFLLPLDESGHIRPRWPQWNFVAAHFFAALFGYWLCRDLGRSRPASLLGGGAFAMSGIVGSLGWPQMLNGAIWLPLVVLFTLRAQRGIRPPANAAWSGVFLGVAFLSGHHQIPAYTLLAMSGLWMFALWRERGRAAAPAAFFFACALLTGAAQLLPVYEFGRNAIRFVGAPAAAGVAWDQHVPYPVHEQYSLFPRETLGLILPHVTDKDVFVGLVIAFLAMYAVTAARPGEARVLLALAIGGLAIAFGGLSVFHGVAYALIPSFDKLRTPAAALVLVQFALAVLAAYGLDALGSAPAASGWIRGLTIAGAAPWPVLAVAAMVRPEAGREYERLAVFGLVSLALAAVLWAWRWQRISFGGLGAAVVLLMLFELGTAYGPGYRHRDAAAGYLAELGRDRDIVEFLRAQPDFTRLEVNPEDVPYNLGDWEGIDAMQSVLPSLTVNVARYMGDAALARDLGPRLFSLSHYLGRDPVRPGQVELFRGRSGLAVYRNPAVQPRVWTVHEAAEVAGPDLAGRVSAADLSRQVFLPGDAPALQVCPGNDKIQGVVRTTNTIRLEAEMACRGMVILSDTYFPGWRAWVDGAEVPVHAAYGVLRGVVVEAGVHRLELEYRPRSVLLGALLSLAGVCAALGLTMWNRTSAPGVEGVTAVPRRA
jgi:hypothetical protein